MDCDSYLILLSGHMDGMNTAAEEAELQAHLKECPQCRQVLAQFRQAETQLQAQTPPTDLTERIMEQVAKEPRNKNRRGLYTVGATLAAAAMLTLVFFHFGPPSLGSKDAAVARTVDEVPAECANGGDEEPYLPEIDMAADEAEEAPEAAGQSRYNYSGIDSEAYVDATESPVANDEFCLQSPEFDDLLHSYGSYAQEEPASYLVIWNTDVSTLPLSKRAHNEAVSMTFSDAIEDDTVMEHFRSVLPFDVDDPALTCRVYTDLSASIYQELLSLCRDPLTFAQYDGESDNYVLVVIEAE